MRYSCIGCEKVEEIETAQLEVVGMSFRDIGKKAREEPVTVMVK